MHANYCYFNGQILPFAETQIHLNELGLLRGFGVFDFLRTYQSVPFELEAHWQRLKNSAHFLDLDLLISVEQANSIVDELLFLRDEPKPEVGFRMVLTGGFSENGSSYEGHPNFFITTETLNPIPEKYYQEGVKVITYEYQREFPQIKTTNYLALYLARDKMKKAQAQDVLYHRDGLVSECSRSNFFVFLGEKLLSPQTGALPGITRQIVLDLAQAHFEVEARDITTEELSQAEEAFKTGTMAEIMPIVQIDEQRIHQGKVGQRTQKLMQLFRDYHQARTQKNRLV